MIRVTAFVFRFGTPKVDENNAPTSIEEIAIISEEERCKAERYWIAQAQDDFSDELKIENLVPFKDGIQRINGRIRKVFSQNQKYPILLLKGHMVSKLIVQQIHDDLYHLGAPRLIAEVKKKYWIIGLRTISRRIGRNCITCRRWRGMALEQLVGIKQQPVK